jgi:tol-pal system protein YbgF
MNVEFNALKMQVAKLQGSVNLLAENIDSINADSNSTVTLEDLAEKVENMRLALESQLAVDLDLQKKQKTVAASAEPVVTNSTAVSGGIAAVVTPEPQKVEVADPAQALYDKALSLFKKRQYEEAIRDWSEFSKTFSKHKLVPNAIFWEGECYYQLGDYANAALKYQGVIAKYQKSNKYRSALLKQGLSLIKLGKKKSGRFILEDLIKKAPTSAEATRAKNILANVK